jgi:beta-lactamase superfamily II metal-dependent hydrolase
MADTGIRIRSYNVGFGDCFLVSFPDGNVTRQMLVDFGNAPGQPNTGYSEIAENIFEETGGHLDLVVMTHEHLDHIEGFYSQKKVFDKMTVDYVWMSLPSHPAYYQDYPNARPLKTIRELAAQFERRLRERRLAVAPSFLTLLRNNLSNPERIDYIRGLPDNVKRVLYLRRGSSVLNKPFSNKIKVKVLAPEKDASVYYGGESHHGLQALSRRLVQARAGNAAQEKDPWSFPSVRREKGNPVNLTERDWRLLNESIQSGGVESVRAIDKAANNTSLVFMLEVGGHRLLFPGDAEVESWEMMKVKCADELKPIDFLKVGHHGSHNGTSTDLLSELLPGQRKDKVTIMVSTKSKVYGTTNPVPDKDLIETLRQRCKKLMTTDGESKLWIDAVL